MNKRKFHSTYKITTLFVCLLCLVFGHVQSQIITKSTPLAKSIEVRLKVDMFDLNITTWAKQELKVQYNLEIEARTTEEVDAFTKKMNDVIEQQLKSISAGKVDANPVFNQITQKNNKITVTFKNDNEKYNLTKLEGKIDVFMPAGNTLNLRSSFNDVSIDDLNANASIDINSVKCKMGNCKALKMKASFTKNMEIGTVDEAIINLNSSDVDITKINGNLDLNASFSNIDVKAIAGDATLDLNSSSFVSGDIKNLKVIGSFVRDLRLNNVDRAEINFNSSNLNAKSIKILEVDKASFSKIDVDQLGSIDITKSSSSKFFFENANKVYCSSCSFTSFDIENLKTSFIAKAQSGDFSIENVTAGFDKIDITGSFLTTRIHIAEGSNYLLDAEMSFPSYKFEGLQTSFRDKNVSHEKIEGWKGDKSKASSRIRFDCQSCKITIN